jgi:hypothetical protein
MEEKEDYIELEKHWNFIHKRIGSPGDCGEKV